MKTFPHNPIGLTKYASWSDTSNSDPLLDQIKARGIPHETKEIPHLVGMAGNAYLLFYVGPTTGMHVTVLCVPIRYDIDAWSEEYYYFEDMTPQDALRDEQWWLDAYDQAKKLVSNPTPPKHENP